MAAFLGVLGAGNKKAAPKGLPFVISGVAARRFGACFALLISAVLAQAVFRLWPRTIIFAIYGLCGLRLACF